MTTLLLILLLVISCVFGEKEAKQCGLRVPSTVKNRPPQLVIAHRGASFHLPEHTLPAYRLALELGADFIEPDLVTTKDGHLVAMHSLDLTETTNVEQVFPDRQSVSKHTNRTGYWVFDFTLEELKTLRVKQRLQDTRSHAFDLDFQIPTLEEILGLVYRWNNEIYREYSEQKRRAGIYAEFKDPIRLETELGTDMVDIFLDELSQSDYAGSILNDTDCPQLKFDEYLVPPLVIQCFDAPVLEKFFNKWKAKFETEYAPPLVLLASKNDCADGNWWYHVEEWKRFLDGVGPDKACFEDPVTSNDVRENAIKHALVIHPWTERPETKYVSKNYHDEFQETIELFCNHEVHGIFTEDVSTALRAAYTDCEGVTPPPTNSPTRIPVDEPPSENCIEKEDNSTLIGLAAGTMGLLIGSIVSIWVSQSRYFMSRRHRRVQLRIPTGDDIEMI